MVDGSHVVLVVDDEAAIRETLRDVLVDDGIAVRAAATGMDALTLLADGLRPCLALVDVRMPGISGWSLAEQMQRLYPSVPVVLMSAQWTYLDKPPVRVADTLRKPFDVERIEQLADEHCPRNEGHCADAIRA